MQSSPSFSPALPPATGPRLAHLSDLHCGAAGAEALQALAQAVVLLRPDLVVATGDLTQRARPSQFQQAAAWLRGLHAPLLLAPGNHDLPLFNLTRRVFLPLARYRRHIAQNLEQEWRNWPGGRVAVLGVNSTTRWRWKAGRLGARRLERLSRRLAALPPEVIRVAAMHHPLPLSRFGGIATGEGPGLDVVLAGHGHRSGAWVEAGVVRVQAGAAATWRQRGEANSFNLLEFQGDSLAVTPYHRRESTFLAGETRRFVRERPGQWRQAG